MSFMRNSLITAATLGVVACGQTSTPTVKGTDNAGEKAFFTALASDKLVVTPPSEAPDIASAFDSLPNGFRVEMGDITINQATGAAEVADFAFLYTFKDFDVGLRAKTAQFWDFNPGALGDRIKGTNLDQSVKVATRIKMTDVTSVGLTDMYEAMMDGYVDIITENSDLGDEFEDGFSTAMDSMEIKTYEGSIGTLIIDNLVMEPFTFTPQTADAEYAMTDVDVMHVFQAIGAGARSFSFDAVMYSDMALELDMVQMGAEMKMDMAIPLSGIRSYKRGDMAYSASWGATFEGQMPFPGFTQLETSDEPVFTTLPMKGGIALSAVSDVHLAKAFEALSKWELPAARETDFMSFGRYIMQNYQFDMDGTRVFNADLIDVDLTESHWLFPTRIAVDVDNFQYDIGGVAEQMFAMMPDEGGPSPDEMAQIVRTINIVNEYDFGCLCGDYNMEVTWNETNGDVKYREEGQFAKAFKSQFLLDMTLPTPSTFTALIEADAEEAAYETVLQEEFSFKSLKGQISDTGGLERAFNMAGAIGQEFKDQPQMAMLAYNTPEQLRELLVNGTAMMKPMVRQELPAAADWLDAVGAFIKDGGTLSFAMKPSSPLTMADMEALDPDSDPDAFVEALNISVTHKK
jgi:hypothetical protein